VPSEKSYPSGQANLDALDAIFDDKQHPLYELQDVA